MARSLAMMTGILYDWTLKWAKTQPQKSFPSCNSWSFYGFPLTPQSLCKCHTAVLLGNSYPIGLRPYGTVHTLLTYNMCHNPHAADLMTCITIHTLCRPYEVP
jgi:hypothetical protein